MSSQMNLIKKIKIDREHRIPWINLSRSYLEAAKKISNSIEQTIDLEKRPWKDIVTVIPLLFLVRQSLELAIKSIYISYGEEFGKIHNLKTLLEGAEKVIYLKNTDKKDKYFKIKDKWCEIKEIVENFHETKYGEERLFSEDDDRSFSLRYYQTNTKNEYKNLKNINPKDILPKVERVIHLCETFTLNFQINTTPIQE